MRISDWSSDVCSSDLQLRSRAEGPLARRRSRRQYRGLLYRLEGYSGSGEPRVGFDPVRDQHRRRRKLWPRVRVHRAAGPGIEPCAQRSEEHTSELQSLMRISYAVFCLKKKKTALFLQEYATTP